FHIYLFGIIVSLLIYHFVHEIQMLIRYQAFRATPAEAWSYLGCCNGFHCISESERYYCFLPEVMYKKSERISASGRP
ncbi:hypothetical protein AB3X35_25095, partial [Raoultella terrigena]|uniref:hypothetical protein n=1 Tax=Raoultella terrigena TaxID=577 RepID=UPI00349F405E